MKVSVLILELQAALEKYGDLEVHFVSDDPDNKIRSVVKPQGASKLYLSRSSHYKMLSENEKITLKELLASRGIKI